MYDFLFLHLATLGISGLCIGILVSFLFPANPARLSGAAAWLQANKDPRPGSSIPLVPYRFVMSLAAVGLFAFDQYVLLLRILIDPILPMASGLAVAVFTLDEALLLVWAVYLVRAFRAAIRPK